MNTASKIGDYAEQLACRYLQQHKLILVCQNYRCRHGEIDLIMQDQQSLVFVEVRYRKNNRFGTALETVDWRKQGKIISTAQDYLARNKKSYPSHRFDVIAVTPSLGNSAENITWIQNAFQLN